MCANYGQMNVWKPGKCSKWFRFGWWLKSTNDWNFGFYSLFIEVSNILAKMKLELREKAIARQLVSGSMIIEFIIARDDRRRVLVENYVEKLHWVFVCVSISV